MSSVIEDRRRELLAFTEEQYRSLDVMEQNPRVLFEGPAGTGKTVLALEATRRAAARGESVLLLCFNRLLGQGFKEEVQDFEEVKASTLHRHLLDVAGLKPRNIGNIDSQFWSSELPEIALETLISGADPEHLWDVLIVDEAQDVLKDPYLDILDLSLKGGLSAGTYRFFGDFEKQNIFTSGGDQRWPGVCQEVSARYSLRTNCRNTPRIAACATLLGGLEPGYRDVLRPDDGVKPKFHYYDGVDAQAPLLAEVLGELRNQGFENEDIVILSPKAARPCAVRLRPPWRDRLESYPDAAPGKIRFTSIHAFKGLESPAVVITDLDAIGEKSSSDLFYVGITRALHRLVILASNRVRHQMGDILLA